MGIFDLFRKKPAQPNNGNSNVEENMTRHCFVLAMNAEPVDLAQVNQAVAEVFGRGYTAELDETIISINQGEDTVGFLAPMPAPIPEGEAEHNADGNILWPDGKEEAAKHQAHVIVTNIGADSQSPIQSAITVTRLALVALKVFEGIGVYWGNASVCNSREMFEDFCEEVSEEHVPVPMWLRFQLVAPAENVLGMYTLGMDQFGLMDLEVDSCSMEFSDLFEFVSNLAHYLIQSGPVIQDGHTVGGTAEERILVRHLPSMIDDEKTVYKIIF